MRTHFAPSWSAAAARGVVGVVSGFAALLWFQMTLSALVLCFGLYALVDGALAVLSSSRSKSVEGIWLVEGFMGMAFGFVAILWFGMTLPPLAGLVALWALATGMLEWRAAIRFRHDVPGDISLALAGSGSLLLGSVMLFWPSTNPRALTILLGCYALVFGASMLLLAFQLRRATRRFARHASAHTVGASGAPPDAAARGAWLRRPR